MRTTGHDGAGSALDAGQERDRTAPLVPAVRPVLGARYAPDGGRARTGLSSAQVAAMGGLYPASLLAAGSGRGAGLAIARCGYAALTEVVNTTAGPGSQEVDQFRQREAFRTILVYQWRKLVDHLSF